MNAEQEIQKKNPNQVLRYGAEDRYDRLVDRMVQLGQPYLTPRDYDFAMLGAVKGRHRDIVERIIQLLKNYHNGNFKVYI